MRHDGNQTNQLCRTRGARVAGEHVRFKWRKSHTKGAIVEIRIRPKHITYDRPEPRARRHNRRRTRRLRAQRLCLQYRGDLIENAARIREALHFLPLCARTPRCV